MLDGCSGFGTGKVIDREAAAASNCRNRNRHRHC
jgi:hypothetical protein